MTEAKEQELNTETNTGRIDFTDHGDGVGVDAHVEINGIRMDTKEGESLLEDMMSKGRPSPAVAATLQTIHLMTNMMGGQRVEAN